MAPNLTLAKNEKQELLGEIYEATNKMIYYFILNIVKDHSLAEDATQEAYIRLSRNMDMVDEDPNSKKTRSFVPSRHRRSR